MIRHAVLPNTATKHLCILLNESLKDERMVAVVQLGKDWFGLINSLSEKDKTCGQFFL